MTIVKDIIDSMNAIDEAATYGGHYTTSLPDQDGDEIEVDGNGNRYVVAPDGTKLLQGSYHYTPSLSDIPVLDHATGSLELKPSIMDPTKDEFPGVFLESMNGVTVMSKYSTQSYDMSEIAELVKLADSPTSSIWESDNLPKWLWMSAMFGTIGGKTTRKKDKKPLVLDFLQSLSAGDVVHLEHDSRGLIVKSYKE